MNSDSKKSKKNNNTLIILKSILKNLNSFILSPTANNLEALTKNLSEYTQLWIDNTSNKLEVPTDDQFKLITSKAYEPYLQKDNLFNESDASRVFELLGIDNDKFKERRECSYCLVVSVIYGKILYNYGLISYSGYLTMTKFC